MANTRSQRVLSVMKAATRRGWTLTELSNRADIGVSLATLSRWASGVSIPPLPVIESLEDTIEESLSANEKSKKQFAGELHRNVRVLADRGWPPPMIADRMDVNVRTVQRWLAGEHRPKYPDVYLAIARAMLEEETPRSATEVVYDSMNRLAVDGVYDKGVSYLAEVCGFSTHRVNKSIKQLERDSLIGRRSRFKGQRWTWNIYSRIKETA